MFEILDLLGPASLLLVGNIFGGGSSSAPAPAPPANPRFQPAAAGETQDQMEESRVQANQLMDLLIQQGIPAEAKAQLDQVLVNSSTEDLMTAVQHLKQLSDSVQQGLISPQELRNLGQQFSTQVQQQVASGGELNFTNISNNVGSQFPDIQARVNDYHTQAQQVQGQADQLGISDPTKFNERFQPALDRLHQDYSEQLQRSDDTYNARGLAAQGSFDENADPLGSSMSGSTPEEHAQAVLAREYGRSVSDAALSAQAAEEQQKVSELNAGSQAKLTSAQGDVTNSQAPLSSIINAGQSALELSAGRNQNLATAATNLGLSQAELTTKMNAGNQGLNASEAGQQGATTQAASSAANAAATLGTALTYKGIPEQSRLADAAGVSASVYGSDLGYAGALAAQQGASQRQTQQIQNSNMGGFMSTAGPLIGTGITALAAMSSLEFKEDVETMSDEDYQRTIDEVLNMEVKNWKYKDGIADGAKHVGIIAEEAPEDMVVMDGKAIDVTSYLGKLTVAVQGLAQLIEEEN